MSVRQGTRIAFLGAGGTGKTTTAGTVSRALDLPMPQSAARRIYVEQELNEDMVADLPPQEQLDLQLTIFAQKKANDQAYEYVTDRTLLDHYAYCLAYCGSYMSNNDFTKFEEQTRLVMLGAYSHLFYFPWGYFESKPDSVRSDRMSWQSKIDAIITGYIVRWNLPVITVPQTKGEDYRSEFILSHITGNDYPSDSYSGSKENPEV